MYYEYNGNLLENDRIDLVSQEIVHKYPQISIEQAKKAAMLEGKISNGKNFDIQFNRLYNIMLIVSDDINNVRVVYDDLINLLENVNNNEKIGYYYDIAREILNYLKGEREFPYLDEF